MTMFAVGEEMNHLAADPQCPECPEGYPERCECGGLVHAAEETDDDEVWLLTACDACGRSEDECGEEGGCGERGR